MPVLPPRLDDRAFDDLVDELLARIPAHTPEWTNPQVGDPGRTLIELFAWLGDTLLYRANLIPERQRLVFLKLLGMQLRPTTPARGLVALTLDPEGPPTPVTFRAGARISGPPDFETRTEVTVLPLEGRIYAKKLLDDASAEAMADMVHDLGAVYRALRPDAKGPIAAYVTTELFPGGAPQRGGFDLVRETADRSLWIALMAPTAGAVTAARESLAEGQEGRPFTLNIGVAPASAPIERLEDIQERRPLRTTLELLTGERIGDRYAFDALDLQRDSTRGLTTDGVLSVPLLARSVHVPTNDAAINPAAGVGRDLPPRLDAPGDAARVVAWLRLRPIEALESLSLTWIGLHAVEVEQSRTIRDLVIGNADGRSEQRVQLPATSIDPSSLALEIRADDGGYETWTRVPDLASQGRDDRVYTLDPEAGSVQFGDGLRGARPPSGARIRVATMTAGGGPEGNLAPGALTEIRGEDPSGGLINALVQVHQRLATRGGVAAETLARAEGRVQSELRHRNRAVTQDDFRSLAAQAPGLRVGRVELLPRFKPQQRREGVPGVVSVMVIPDHPRPGLRAPAPRPDRPFVETMHAWLDARRLIGTELYVIGPEYIPIGVSVGVDLRSGHPIEQTLAAIRLALRAFFWPLAPGGPGSAGWPLGMKVIAAQAEIAVARVRGVAALRGLHLFQRHSGAWTAIDRSLALAAWQLPELLSVVAVAGIDAPQTLRGAPSPFADGDPDGDLLPIPVVPEVC